jgi:hypothetical protein
VAARPEGDFWTFLIGVLILDVQGVILGAIIKEEKRE